MLPYVLIAAGVGAQRLAHVRAEEARQRARARAIAEADGADRADLALLASYLPGTSAQERAILGRGVHAINRRRRRRLRGGSQ